jgi:hypothetical protein
VSTESRPVAQLVTVCDLCGETLPDDLDAMERGSLTHGFLSHSVHLGVSGRTKHAWLIWPRRKRLGPAVREVHYDFHADCIGRLVEDAVAARNADLPVPGAAGEEER